MNDANVIFVKDSNMKPNNGKISDDILINIIDYLEIYQIIQIYFTNSEINSMIDKYIWKKLLDRDFEVYMEDINGDEMEEKIRNNKNYCDKERYINLYISDKLIYYCNGIFHYIDQTTKELKIYGNGIINIIYGDKIYFELKTPKNIYEMKKTKLYDICYYLDPDTTDMYVREIIYNNEYHDIYKISGDIIMACNNSKINKKILTYFEKLCKTFLLV